MNVVQTFEFCFPSEADAKVKVQISTYRKLSKQQVKTAYVLLAKYRFPSENITNSVQRMAIAYGQYLLCLHSEKKRVPIFPGITKTPKNYLFTI